MKIKGIFLVLIFGFQISIFSQKKIERPNYKKIKREIKKKRSDFYYPVLVKKYSRGLPMTSKEKQYFYYGFAFFNFYEPYKVTKYYDKINQIVASKDFSEGNLNRLLHYINLELASHPFNLDLLKLKIFVFKRQRNQQQLQITKGQIQVIKDAILSSGNGKTKETAYAVIFISNEYDVLQFLNLKPFINNFVDKKLEYIKIKENPKGIKGLYFDVSLITRRINAKQK